MKWKIKTYRWYNNNENAYYWYYILVIILNIYDSC